MNIGDVLICKKEFHLIDDGIINIGDRFIIFGNSPINRDFYGENIYEIKSNNDRVSLRLKYVQKYFETMSEYRVRVIEELI